MQGECRGKQISRDMRAIPLELEPWERSARTPQAASHVSATLPASRRQGPREPCSQVGRLIANAHVERSKQGIERTGGIKTHFIDELFKDQWIIGKQADAPFPVVQTDGTTD